MYQISGSNNTYLPVYSRQRLPLFIKKWYSAVTLLALSTLLGGWIVAMNRPPDDRKMKQPVVNAIHKMADGVDIFDVARAEEGGSHGTIAFRMLNGATAPVDITIIYTINATVTNAAINGVDVTTLPTSITLPAGQTEVLLDIAAIDDSFIEGDENLEFTMTSAMGTNGVDYLTPHRGLTTTVIDNDNRISIEKINDGKELGSGNASDGNFLISLPPTLTFNEDIHVKYAIGGTTTATGGPGATYDYNNSTLTGDVILPANTNSLVLPIKVNDDQLVEGNEVVEMTIQDNSFSAVSNIKFSYNPAKKTAIVVIEDDDINVPIGVQSTVNGKEPGGAGNDGSFVVGWPNGYSAAVSILVRYTITGTATNGADYNTITLTKTILSGTSNVTIPVTVKDDPTIEGPETVILTITSLTGLSGLTIGTTNNPGTVTIQDNDVKSSQQWKSASYPGTTTGAPVKAGELITYTVHVRNTGNVNLTGVTIADNVPANTQFVSADGGIVPDATGKLTWTIPTIAVGVTNEIRRFTVKVVNDLTGVTNITNTALVNNGDGTGDHPTTQPDPGNPDNPSSTPDPSNPSTNIPVDGGGYQSANWKSASYTGSGTGGKVKTGDLITYTIHVRNTGHIKIPSVVINDKIPAYTTFVSADGGIVPDGTGKLTWTVTDIPVGSADVTRSFVVKVATDLTGATSILNTAGVDNGDGTGEHPTTPPDPSNPNNPDPTPDPNDPSTEVPVDQIKTSANWKSASYTGTGTGGKVKTGDEITYTIHIRNTGNVTLTNVLISDMMPAYTTFVSADGGIVPDGTGKLSWTIPSIAVGAADVVRSFKVKVAADLTGATTIVNTAGVDNGDGTGGHPTTPPDPNDPNNPDPTPDPNDPSTEIPVDNNKSSANWKSATYTGTGASGKVKAGDEITYFIHVRNTGNVTLTNVKISDVIPAYTSFISADGGIVPDGTGKLTWTVPSIAVGAADVVRSFKVKVVNDLTGATSILNTGDVDNGDGTGGHPTTPPDPNNPNNPDPTPDPNDPSTDIPTDDGGNQSANWKSASYTGTGTNGKVKTGDLITYTIHVRNTGHRTIPSVVVNDKIPAYTVFVSADGGIVPDATGKLTWTLTNIPVGGADVLRSFVVKVATDLTGATSIINTAGVDNGDGTGEHPTTPPDPNNPNNPDPTPDPNDPSTEVPVDQIIKSANWKSASYTGTGTGGKVKAGDEITYTIHIRNTGNVTLTNVLITDMMPAYTTFVSADGGITPDGTGKLSWTIPGIAVGAADAVRSFKVKVATDLTGATTITNTAGVDNGDGTGGHPTTPPDPNNPNDPHSNPDPNDPSTEIPVDNNKNSANWKSAAYTGTGVGGKVKAGDEITYTIHVRNIGSEALTNVTITDVIPAYTSFVSADGGIVPDAAKKLTWTIPNIAVGAPDVVRSFKVLVIDDLTGVTSITNTADVDNGDGTGGHPTTPPDPNDPNNPQTNPDPNDPSTDIPADDGGNKSVNWKSASYTGSGTNGKVKTGDIITYTIHVRNTGHITLASVIVTDKIPAYTEFVSADGGITPDGTGKLTWTLTNIPVNGADVTRSFVVRVATDLTDATTIVNTAGIDNGDGTGEHPSVPPDPNDPNNPQQHPNPNDPSTEIPVEQDKSSVNWKSAAYTGTGVNGMVKAGDVITYTIHVRNTGNVKLENVVISDVIPAYTEFISADGGITPDGTGKLTWTIPDILFGAPDAVRSFKVKVATDLTGAGYITNTANVDNGDGTGGHPTTPADPNDPNNPHPNPDPNDPSTEIPVDNGMHSDNWKSASYTGTGANGGVTTGDQITYTIHVRNSGNATLSNVVISDDVPAYTEFVSAEGGISPSSGKLTWTIATIPVGSADVTRSFTVKVVEDLTGAVSIINTAVVDNGNGKGNDPTHPADPNDPNNPMTNPPPGPATNVKVDTLVRFEAWKGVVTASGADKASPGEILTYTIHVRNTGNVKLPLIKVTDPIPALTTFESAEENGLFNAGSNTVTWEVKDIPVAAVVDLTFKVKVADRLDSGAVITNTAVASDGTTDKPTSGCDPHMSGCSGTPGTVIETNPSDDLQFANAMSPNGDGKNEYFVIKGLERYPPAALYVFNRWGSMVYQTKEYKNDWAAKGLSEGTYYYKLELKLPGGTKLYKGWIVIKRN
ncbi:DUF7507 domain-containing protein [Chitinophaga ginsengisoli]|uniref:Putative repeat protein (TIGR01451 family)/gliding motility-associated-like protein n=1 Tax=Chitinophaga ginsengisoli TaxID=363837 RepID=A0A2P8FS02_9BACT|nr:gliding motility-associated C-terminal domain-containing protein [Chitinophaga ginsengisoli]PSL24512.1 putative repeat protein (TIGR01451 family)/gliding motility-associated-like protein [Chitinophaga ginsengisoli]